MTSGSSQALHILLKPVCRTDAMPPYSESCVQLSSPRNSIQAPPGPQRRQSPARHVLNTDVRWVQVSLCSCPACRPRPCSVTKPHQLVQSERQRHLGIILHTPKNTYTTGGCVGVCHVHKPASLPCKRTDSLDCKMRGEKSKKASGLEQFAGLCSIDFLMHCRRTVGGKHQIAVPDKCA